MKTKKEIIRGLIKKNAPTPSSYGTDPNDPWSAKANITEDVLTEAGREALLDKYLYAKGINPKYVTKDVRISHSKSGRFLKYQKDHENDRDELPGQMEETDLTEDKKPPTHEVVNIHTGERKGLFSSKQRARNAVDKHDNAYGSYAHRVRELPKPGISTSVAEENLDELSKDTIDSYREKAFKDLDKHKAERDKIKDPMKNLGSKSNWKMNTRLKGLLKTVAREEVESIEELSKGTLKSYSKAAGTEVSRDIKDSEGASKEAEHHAKYGNSKSAANWKDEAGWLKNRAEKRAGNIAKATTKIAQKEDLDELSKPTMKAYAAKSANSVVKNFGEKDKTDTIKKRTDGIKTAWRKITQKPVSEDNYIDAKAATQDNGGLGGADLIEKKKIIKALVKKKRLGEELFDTDKESKSVKTPGKKPVVSAKDFDKKLNDNDETGAAAVLKGGTTMTGDPRDTIIIDPSLRKPTVKGMNKQPDFPEKDQKNGPR